MLPANSCRNVGGYPPWVHIYLQRNKKSVRSGTAQVPGYTYTGAPAVPPILHGRAYDSQGTPTSARIAALCVTLLSLGVSDHRSARHRHLRPRAPCTEPAKLVPAICGTGSINGPCNYVSSSIWHQVAVQDDTTNRGPSGPGQTFPCRPVLDGSGSSHWPPTPPRRCTDNEQDSGDHMKMLRSVCHRIAQACLWIALAPRRGTFTRRARACPSLPWQWRLSFAVPREHPRPTRYSPANAISSVYPATTTHSTTAGRIHAPR